MSQREVIRTLYDIALTIGKHHKARIIPFPKEPLTQQTYSKYKLQLKSYITQPHYLYMYNDLSVHCRKMKGYMFTQDIDEYIKDI